MFFRNLTLFRFSAETAAALDRLDAALDAHRLRSVGPLELATHGFVSPLGAEEGPLSIAIGACTLLTLGREEKLLPAAVIHAELARRVRAAAEQRGQPVGGRERKRLKEAVLEELLPRAFARPSRLSAYLDRKNGWVVLDTSSRKAAEQMLTNLRQALDSFPALPLAPEQTPRLLMTDWLSRGKLPAGLSLGDECELRDPAGAQGAVVRCRRQALESEEVREHLKSGKQATQLGLEFDGRLAFVLGEDLCLRKLRFLDVVQDELDSSARESAAAEVDARFALMTLELERLLDKLAEWFGLPRPGAD